MTDRPKSIETIITERLAIDPITLAESDFILELVNTAGWIEYIGNRNINSTADARVYIRKIIDNPDIVYWVARLKDSQTPIGIVTFIKRDYLEYNDIGFAFLPEFSSKGYAFESASAVLHAILRQYKHPFILATTISNNTRSIRLLNKLQLQHEKEIEVDNEKLQVYSASTDKIFISEITRLFYSVLTGKGGLPSCLDLLSAICIPEVLLVLATGTESIVQSPPDFITQRATLPGNCTLAAFEQKEVYQTTSVLHHLAYRVSGFEKSGVLNAKRFTTKGYLLFQFVKINQEWKICSVVSAEV